MTTQPLNDRVPIINSDGTPTQFFLRQLQERGITVDGKITAEEAEELIAAWAAARDVNVTAPITGGGPLSSDITIGLDNSGVTPGSYTNTDLTVDAFGRITAASNGAGGGGGGLINSYIGWFSPVGTAQGCNVGFFFTPSENITVMGYHFIIAPPSTTATYRAVAAAVNGSNVIQSVTLGTTTWSAPNTTTRVGRVKFASAVTLTAGTKYFLGVNRNDGIASAPVQILAGQSPIELEVPGLTDPGFCNFASITPVAGDTVTYTASPFRFSMGLVYTW